MCKCNKFLDYIKNNCRYWLLFLSGILVVVVGMHFITEIEIKFEKNPEVYCAFAAAIATFILAYIAVSKSAKFVKIDQVNYLLRIDERWGNDKIFEARKLIRWFRNNKTDISQEMIKYSKSETLENVYKYCVLVELLEFMDTIGYLVKEKLVDKKEVEFLYSGWIVGCYNDFSDYIRHMNKEENHDVYHNFVALAKYLNKENYDA